MLVEDRETLESLALEACPNELWYDLNDTLHECTDEQLWYIIETYSDKVVVE